LHSSGLVAAQVPLDRQQAPLSGVVAHVKVVQDCSVSTNAPPAAVHALSGRVLQAAWGRQQTPASDAQEVVVQTASSVSVGVPPTPSHSELFNSVHMPVFRQHGTGAVPQVPGEQSRSG